MNNKNLLILPRYTAKGPSSRVRFYQYLPYLQEAGWNTKVEPFFDNEYINTLFNHQAINLSSILSAYAHRFATAIKSSGYDLIWMQYELLPWLPTWLEKVLLAKNVPLVIDYDDAVFHRYDTHRSILVRKLLGNKIAKVMKNATALTLGNSYLAQWATKAGSKSILQIPSVVDTERYQINHTTHEAFTIGWIGTPKTVHYVEMLEPVFRKVLDPQTRLLIVGAQVPNKLRDLHVESQPWNLATEVVQIQQFDVGIMPLVDEPFERGKCGYKLIQYMACGLPVIASPVGANQEIVEHNINGFLATSKDDWINALQQLKSDSKKAQIYGTNGHLKVETAYSIKKNAPRLIAFFEQQLSA